MVLTVGGDGAATSNMSRVARTRQAWILYIRVIIYQGLREETLEHGPYALSEKLSRHAHSNAPRPGFEDRILKGHITSANAARKLHEWTSMLLLATPYPAKNRRNAGLTVVAPEGIQQGGEVSLGAFKHF